MANKITETISLKITGASFAASMSGAVTIDQVGSNYTEETQTIISADAVALDIGAGIAEGSLGYLIVKNLAAAPVGDAEPNNIDIATDEPMANKIATIGPGKSNYISPPAGTVALWGQAQVTDAQIVFLAIEK